MNAIDCKHGEERWLSFWSPSTNQYLIQYDYRAKDGELFSCVARTVEDARGRRYKWAIMRQCEEFASLLKNSGIPWGPWIIYILEALDTNSSLYESRLDQLAKEIEKRLQEGQW